MKIGDVVQYDGSRWKVLSHSRELRLFTLMNLEGSKVEVPDDSDKGEKPAIAVLYNPADSWPFAIAKMSPRSGPIVEIKRGARVMSPLVDWVPSDFIRPGGALFFSPYLRLKTGEILVVVHKNGHLSRITITKAFGTVHRKKARAARPEVKPLPSSYDRILDGNMFGDDE